MKRSILRALTALLAVGALSLSPITAPAAVAAPAPTVVSSVDFEDGTIGNWTKSGGPTLEVVADPAGGTGRVLAVSGRTAGHDTIQSPTSLFDQGVPYTFSARVYVPAAASEARFVVKDGYTWVGNTTVPADTWTTVSATYTADADDTQVYFEVKADAPVFYLDDVLITRPGTGPAAPTIPEGQQLVAWNDFSEAALGDSLRQSGGTGVTFADGALTVNGRNADYVGIETVPGLLESGVQYTVSAKIKLAAGTPGTQARWVGVPGYNWIGNANVTADDWTTISGSWLAPAAEDPSTLKFYIGTQDITDVASYTYLVDDVIITKTVDECGEEPPVQEPGTVLIDEDFEDGALGGWTARQGSGSSNPTVGVVEGGAAGTAHAAQVEGRTHEGDGIQFGVKDLLLPGKTYKIEAYVRFAPGSDVGRGLTVSMRTVTGGSQSFGNLVQVENATATGWTKVSGEFSVPGYDDAAELYFEARYNSGNTSTFLVDEITVSVPEPQVVDLSLTPLKDTAAFPVGVAIDERETTGPASELLLHHFDQITAENHMKVEAWYDSSKQFVRNSQATALLDFAKANDLRVYGHVLLWHSQTPAWFFQDDDGRELTDSAADKQLLRDRLRTHIDNVAKSIYDDYGAYGSATNPVVAWDVVNEVVSDQATADGLRTSRWHDVLGEEYIHLAFQYADAA